MNILNWFKNDYELIKILEIGGYYFDPNRKCYGRIFYSKSKNKYKFEISNFWINEIYKRMEVMCENRIIELKQNK